MVSCLVGISDRQFVNLIPDKMGQNIIAATIVILAIVFTVFLAIKRFNKKSKTDCTGCDGCALRENCDKVK